MKRLHECYLETLCCCAGSLHQEMARGIRFRFAPYHRAARNRIIMSTIWHDNTRKHHCYTRTFSRPDRESHQISFSNTLLEV